MPRVLTARQLEVLARVAAGASYAELAVEWCIAETTVRGYGHRAVLRLGANSLPHAVLIACRAGLIDGRPQRHGDHAGYAAHVRRGEDPCPACREGERHYRTRSSRQEAA